MRATPIILLLFVLSLSAAPETRADGGGLGGEAGFFVGALFPDEDVAGESNPSAEVTVGGRVGLVLHPRWTWFVDGTYAEIDTETGFGTAQELTGRTGAEFLFRPDGRYGWFVNAGAGWINFDYDQSDARDFHRPLGSVGTGQAIRWGATKRIRWEARADVTLDDARLDGASVVQGRFVVGLSWGPPRAVHSPGASRQADLDGDGVRNRKDNCPGTPPGAAVDKVGCPRDSDGDDVFDGIDRCPGTPSRARVDAFGCMADGDGDGVHDGSDACPRTPAGAVVDDWGCPEDRDGDGVADGLDRCPGTPFGAEVDESGCAADADGDGVPDGVDRCDGTPAGTAVDRRGCPDE